MLKNINIEVTKCPLKEVTSQSWAYIEAYNQYKNGFFPYNEGWLEQPAKLLGAIGLIEKLKEEVKNAE